MTALHDLNTQIAQRLFGWRPHPEEPEEWWLLPDGDARILVPAYTTDPAATAQVWQWVEEQGHGALLHRISFGYYVEGEEWPFYGCVITLGQGQSDGSGATWQEALCRAALALVTGLALAEVLEGKSL